MSVILFSNCSTVPPQKKRTKEEVIKRDSMIGEKLAQTFEPQMRYRQDTEVTTHLIEIAKRLVSKLQDMYSEEPNIRLIELPKTPTRISPKGSPKSQFSTWRSFSLPGNRIYLSLELLKKLEFENEVAALMAIQLGHITNKNLINNLEKKSKAISNEQISFEKSDAQYLEKLIQKLDFGELSEAFKFSDEEEIVAMKSAVYILYQGGYDARGMITLYKKYLENQNSSPYSASFAKTLIARARKEIALYTPLRNPLIQSDKFIDTKKRIQDL